MTNRGLVVSLKPENSCTKCRLPVSPVFPVIRFLLKTSTLKRVGTLHNIQLPKETLFLPLRENYISSFESFLNLCENFFSGYQLRFSAIELLASTFNFF